MPIYEFLCKSCGTEFELVTKGNEPPQCPKCHSQDAQKKWSIFGGLLKKGKGLIEECNASSFS